MVFIAIMKHMKCLAFYAVLIVVIFLSACDLEMENNDNNSFASHLRGEWVSNDSSVYSGTLEIAFDRMTIRGYEEGQTPALGGNDNQRPFRNFIKGIALKGYSEEQPETNGFIVGFIFIEDAGLLQEGISYTYWYDNPPPNFRRVHFLRFGFGGRQETLLRTE